MPYQRFNTHISCTGLRNADVGSKSDPMVLVYTRLRKKDNWKFISCTERVEDCLDPVFTRGIVYHFCPALRQSILFRVVDIDSNVDASAFASEDPFLKDSDDLGEFETTASALVRGNVRGELKNLYFGKKKARGEISLVTELATKNVDEIEIRASARGLPKADGMFGKADPYLIIKRSVEGGEVEGFNNIEDVQKNTLNPVWPARRVPLSELNNGNYGTILTCEVWDWDANSDNDFMCSTKFCLDDFAASAVTDRGGASEHWHVYESELTYVKKGKVKSAGTIEIKYRIIKNKTFAELVAGGKIIKTAVAIDWTGSNGRAIYEDSLHLTRPEPFNTEDIEANLINPYMRVMYALASILLQFDDDGRVPLFGHGGIVDGETNFCFALNGTKNPEVAEVAGLLHTYWDALKRYKFSGPTYFRYVIRRIIEMYNAMGPEERENTYYNLIIICDGMIDDFDETVNLLRTVSKLPISISIVGVGDADFSDMKRLDDLPTDAGGSRIRDCVNFTSSIDYLPDDLALLDAVMDEFECQFTDFYNNRNQ